jgi:hypothetical protein
MALIAQCILLLFLVCIIGYEILILIEFVRLHRGEVPFVASTTPIIEAAIATNTLPKDGMILDLGCGDGKALRLFERAGYRGPLIGYETAPYPWVLSKLIGVTRRSNVTILREDFAHAPLEQAKGVYLFLLKETLASLGPILSSRLPSGTPVISAEFEIAGWIPEKVLNAPGVTSRQARIFIYRTPNGG